MYICTVKTDVVCCQNWICVYLYCQNWFYTFELTKLVLCTLVLWLIEFVLSKLVLCTFAQTFLLNLKGWRLMVNFNLETDRHSHLGTSRAASLQLKTNWNVHGRNIKYYLECTWTEHYILCRMYMDWTLNTTWNVHGQNITYFVECTWMEHYT